MNKILVLQYPKCSTCQKAIKWLTDNNVEFETRHIVEQNPTKEELGKWLELSQLPISKFFNTSGLRYRALNIKDKIKTAPTDELLDILASEGMLVKRPLVVTDKTVLTGFKEQQWTDALL